MWTPQEGPQLEAIQATWCDMLFFGGARGGGKSEFTLGDYLQDVPTYGRHWQGIVFRRTFPALQPLIRRAKELYLPTGAEWKEGKRQFQWPNGAVLKFRHLEREGDADKYQGHQYTWIAFEELPQWPNLEPFKKLTACLRWSEAEVPTKRIRASGNPGGIGHGVVKEFFGIDEHPLGSVPFEDEAGMTRMFIASKVTDNKILLERDPEYVNRLKGVGSPELVRAWLEGDWSVIQGAYYPEFGDRHILAPFALPKHWSRYRAFDWGSAAPFATLWGAVSDGKDDKGKEHEIPRGALVIYREDYGSTGKPNEGLKLSNDKIAKRIKELSFDEQYLRSVADPAIFSEQGGPSIAEQFRKAGITFRRADNSRLAGWSEIRKRLAAEKPLIYFFSTLKDTIRTLPLMQHSERNPEDLDTTGEDHLIDTLRYLCMARPIETDFEGLEEPKPFGQTTYAEEIKHYRRRNKKRI